MALTHLIMGQTLAFDGSPFEMPIEAAARHESHGAIAVSGGQIIDMGPREAMIRAHPRAKITDYGESLITAGFVDAHVHFPQTAIIASWGKRLIDWLNEYTFPEEMRFGDAGYAKKISERYLDLALAHGTTTMASFCTIHPESVEAFFASALARDMRVVGGKTCMDRNAPEGLLDSAKSAYDDSKALLEKWHGRGRLGYAITPRFSPTSTPEQLAALGALWAEHPDCLMQTHLGEQVEEIAWVKELYPNAKDYLDTYETHGLLGKGGLYGHAIHLEPRERDRLAEMDASLIHCPTSNTFIGSGLFETARHCARGLRVGLATDTGGGSSFSMLRTMAAAYEIGQLSGTPLHPAQLIWLATQGSARALHLQGRVGNLAIGQEADLVVLDLHSTPAIAQATGRAETIWQALFPSIMMGDDRAIEAVWINGALVPDPS